MMRSHSIRRKLMCSSMLVIALAVVLSCASFLVMDVAHERREIVENLNVTASMVAESSTASLQFGDAKEAAGILASLKRQGQLVGALLLDLDGKVLAEYRTTGTVPLDRPPLTDDGGHAYGSGGVSVWRPVVLNGRRVGTVYLHGDLTETYHRIRNYILIGLAVGILSIVVAGVLAIPLTRALTLPVSELARTARQISRSGDYSLRASYRSNDEVGVLADALNAMIEQIQTRDRQLHEHKEHLEEEVAARTEELRRSNADLAAARDRAEAASRAKSAFLANMSHEIRTPMTAMIGFADLLSYPEQSPKERQDYIQTIRRNGQHLMSLINDILDLSKIEAGQMTVERLAVSPFQVTGEAASFIRARAMEKNLQFRLEYSGPIPRTITTDPTRLRQVLMNLLSNAIKFTETGSVRLVVSMADPPTATNPRIRFDAIDTGIGIAPAHLERIFAPFTQADESTTRRFGGTGLGLAISKRLVELMGGTIAVVSKPGQGSTFTVTVETGPLAGVPMVDRCEVLGEGGVTSTPPRPTGALRGRVLLAEDGADNQRLIAFILTHAGAQVEVVENGRLAVDRVLATRNTAERFDLVLMDMQMPEMDGYSATAQLREQGATLPIVALTAHAMAGDRERCLAAGCTDYLTKPVNAELLVATAAGHMALAGRFVAEPECRASLRSEFADDEVMKEIVGQFVRGLPEHVARLRRLLDASEMDSLRRVAHQLKGSGGGYGFAAISTRAAEVEACIREAADVNAVREQVEGLVGLLRCVDGYDPAKEKADAPETPRH
ncbi:MAG: ATP-binding protein [Tepidisphaerales bacterium]